MSTTKDKLLQYLNEAQATEQALVSTLRGHVAMTPRGEYRDDLEEHLRVTRRHAQLVRERIGRLGTSFKPLALGLGLAETIAGQVLALGKMPMFCSLSALSIRCLSPVEGLAAHSSHDWPCSSCCT